MERHTMELIEGFRKLDTSCISDAMDRLAIKGCLSGIHPITPGQRICGPAYTVHFVPCGEKKGPVGGYIDDVDEGNVIVIDNAGRLDCSVWGDIMAFAAKQKKIEATLIDGACRDVAALKESGYPVFAKGCCMATGNSRVEVDALCVPVSVSNVQIRPGDFIIADDTGAIAVPFNHAEEVLQVAEEISNNEKEIMKLLKSGRSLKKAMQLYGLQKRA